MIHLLSTHMHTSATWLRSRGIGAVDLGIILGSGFDGLAEVLSDRISIPYGEVPHLPVSGVVGHKGILSYGRLGGKQVLMFRGRLHGYEGYPLWQVTYPIRIMQALGVPEVLLTAAAGGLREGMHPGDLVLVSDHINLMGNNPLSGLTDPLLGERFVEMQAAYNPICRARMHAVGAAAGLAIREGVYAAMRGPSLETPAECRFLNQIGADVVGMSVVPEVIVGVQAGIRMVALCVVTNLNWPPERATEGDSETILRQAVAMIPGVTSVVQNYALSVH